MTSLADKRKSNKKNDLAGPKNPNYRHGMSGSPEYMAWQNMKARCNNPESTYYHYYGGRGIKVCEDWNDFDNFIRDIGARPSKKHSIDRIDNNGNYTKANCRWATRQEQERNKRKRVACLNGHEFTQESTMWVKGRFGLVRTCVICYKHRLKKRNLKRQAMRKCEALLEEGGEESNDFPRR